MVIKTVFQLYIDIYEITFLPLDESVLSIPVLYHCSIVGHAKKNMYRQTPMSAIARTVDQKLDHHCCFFFLRYSLTIAMVLSRDSFENGFAAVIMKISSVFFYRYSI